MQSQQSAPALATSRLERTAHCGSPKKEPTTLGVSPQQGLSASTPSQRRSAVRSISLRDQMVRFGLLNSWVTRSGASPDGVISEYSVPTLNSAPLHITAWVDGALWFTEFAGNKIGRIT